MASNTLNARLQLRYDTFMNWMNSDVILLPGEIAIATMQNRKTLSYSDAQPDNTPPAIGIKVGDGTHYFYELPWLQAVSADVYNWAKASTKPTYTANEISGLAEYISQQSSSAGGSSSGMYRIIYDSANNKYILQQYNNDLEVWENTNSEIDFNSLINRIITIENWANGSYNNIGNIELPLVAYIQDKVVTFINRLNVDDSPITHQFVTSVSESQGKISVTHSGITASDITSGVLSTAQGGTGFSDVSTGEILIGSATGKLQKTNISTSIDVNEQNNIPTTGALISYVNTKTAGLTGAMHFIGESNIDVSGGNNHADPQIGGYSFKNAQPGDVILYNTKEYVWTGSIWQLLGDEGSYAIKGSIKDADIDAEANISQSKIANLTETFAGKVDKVEGKQLSSNDFTDEYKIKLQNIEESAQVNKIEHILLNGTESLPHTVNNVEKTVELNISEFDAISRAKLATIQEYAQVNDIAGISLNGTTLTPDNNKIVALTIKEFDDESRAKLATIQEGAQVNPFDTLYLNGKQILPDNNKRLDLSIREYPKIDEDKLKTIQEGAQANVIERIKFDNVEILPDQDKVISILSNPHTEHENIIEHITLNGTEQTPTNKIVALTIDQDFIKGAEMPATNNAKEDITIIQKKLQLSRIAASGNISELIQSDNTYILIDCGSSTEVI